MKKLFITFFCLISFKVFAQENLLKQVNNITTLEMKFTDDKCGEWGGNETKIIVYRNTFNGQLLADYSVKNMDCYSKNGIKIVKDKKAIVLNAIEIQLIIDSLEELIRQKINNPSYPSHSGLHSEAKLCDSSLLIDDFPSSDWIKFKELSIELEK